MTTAAELRAEAQHLRKVARHITDKAVVREILWMIEELERRARRFEPPPSPDLS